jgi:hypothetical protein
MVKIMGFMERQITQKQLWWEVETTHGTEWLPVELVGKEPDSDAFADYCEGQVLSWEQREGFGARLSAPGYLDCTEWSVFDTKEEAEAYLDEYYPEDEDGEDEEEGSENE